jgi:hypothetical protein
MEFNSINLNITSILVIFGMSNIFIKKDTTSIRVTDETRDKLAELGGKDDTFEEIIQRLILEHTMFSKKYILHQTPDGAYYTKRKDVEEEHKKGEKNDSD